LFSWIRIRIQKGFYDQENAVEKNAKYAEEEDRKYPWPGSGFDKKKYFSIESGYIKPRRFTGIHEGPDLEY
jgi:hypothetical protein